MKLKNLIQKFKKRNLKKLPTAKKLRESEKIIIQYDKDDIRIVVYESGYAEYSTSSSKTVLDVCKCCNSNYTYKYQNGSCVIMCEELKEMDWRIALALFGEDSIEKNLMNRKGDRKGNKVNDPSWEYIKAMEPQKNEISPELLECLTEREKNVIFLYFSYQLTQQQIATQMHISQQSVSVTLRRAVKKITKKIS